MVARVIRRNNLTLKNLYHPRHTCITLDYVSSGQIGCQGDTEKYLTRGNLYHPRHTCITRDVVEGNTSVSRVIQHVITDNIVLICSLFAIFLIKLASIIS